MEHYQPNQPYDMLSQSQYGPESTLIPPADSTNDENRKPVVIFDDGTIYNLSTNKYGDTVLLGEISRCQPLRIEPTIIDWHYNLKATAQDILPFLMLGPLGIVRDAAFVSKHQITMVIGVRDGKSAAINPKIMDPARFASTKNIETLTFDVFDEFDLIRRIPELIRRMVEHLATRTVTRPIAKLEDVVGRILVFCEAGDKRSAAVVALFLMVVFGLPTESAIQAVQARRYGTNITGMLYRSLKNCEDVLRAERKVAETLTMTSIAVVKSIGLSHKRTLDEVEAEDVDMEYGQEQDNMHRVGLAPFKDKEA